MDFSRLFLTLLLTHTGLANPVEKRSENVACADYKTGDLLNGFEMINIPLHSDVYPNNLDCKWQFTIPEGKFLQIIIRFIDLEFYTIDRKLERNMYYGQACRYDSLRVYNHANIGNMTLSGVQKSAVNYPAILEKLFGKLIANLCHGDEVNSFVLRNGTFNLWSKTGQVMVNFISDKDVQKAGIHLQVQLQDLQEGQCKACLDYESVLNEIPARRITPNQGPHGRNQANSTEKIVPLAMAVMLPPFLCCIMIGLIKQVENDQMDNMVMRELLVQNPSATNCSYGAQVARAQNALMAGLLERRPSVLELASRLVQEDQLYMQARQANSTDLPPGYVDPLAEQTVPPSPGPPPPVNLPLITSSSSSLRNLLRSPKIENSSSPLKRQTSENSLLPSYSNAMIDSDILDGVDSLSTETVVPNMETSTNRRRGHERQHSISSNSFTQSEIIYEDSEFCVQNNHNTEN